MKEIQGVKGLQGYWHIANGSWDKSHNKVRTLCGVSVSPSNRDIPLKLDKVDCPHCKTILAKRQPECEFCGGSIGG